MFGLFQSNPIKKLEKEYQRKLAAAREATRSGKIPLSATLTAEAEEIARRIDALQQSD